MTCPRMELLPHAKRGRIPALVESGRLSHDLQLPPLDAACDRVMVCGSLAMVTDTRVLLDARGFTPRRASVSRGLRD